MTLTKEKNSREIVKRGGKLNDKTQKGKRDEERSHRQKTKKEYVI